MRFLSAIIGVLPPNFYFLDRETDIWGPLGLDPAQDYRKTSGRFATSVGRLRPGVSNREAQAHMAALAKRLEQAYPEFNTNWRVNLEPVRDALFRNTKTPLLVLLAAVILLLAVGARTSRTCCWPGTVPERGKWPCERRSEPGAGA